MTDPRRRVVEILKQSEHPWPNSLVCTKAFNELGTIATEALDREAEARKIIEPLGAAYDRFARSNQSGGWKWPSSHAIKWSRFEAAHKWLGGE